jgi:hypothetical protein
MAFNTDEVDHERICDSCGFPYTIQDYLDEQEFLENSPSSVDPYKDQWTDFCSFCFFNDKWLNAYGNFGRFEAKKKRTCKGKHCGTEYTILEYWLGQKHYFDSPWDYATGCRSYCLSCWLTGDEGADETDTTWTADTALACDTDPQLDDSVDIVISPVDSAVGHVSDMQIYRWLCEGDIQSAYQAVNGESCQVAILPLERIRVSRVVPFPGMINFFPAGLIDLERYPFYPCKDDSTSLSEHMSAVSGMNLQHLVQRPLVVVPIRWDIITTWNHSHDSHMQFLRYCSEHVERHALNYLRYQQCKLGLRGGLPCHPGQVPSSNIMMSCIGILDFGLGLGNIIGGAAFDSVVTKDLGLDVPVVEWDNLPKDGEVGNLVRRALTMYSEIVESSSLTSRFVRTMTLFEFLAYPDGYEKMQDVRKVIARYSGVADTPEYNRISLRFMELTSGVTEKQKAQSFVPQDYAPGLDHALRTRLVHHGERFEDVIKSESEQRKFFDELEGFLRPVIEHMIEHSALSFDEYKPLRDSIKVFQKATRAKQFPVDLGNDTSEEEPPF